MSWFQLDPQNVATRAQTSVAPVKIPSFAETVARGVIGFTLLSFAGFAPWAFAGRWFYRNVGELGLYVVCAAAFILLSGPLLHRLIIGPGSLSRFYKVFTLAFVLYSVLWIVGWMTLRGHPGSVAGLLAGTAAMGTIVAYAFDAKGNIWKIIAALFVLNSIGYFVGGVIEAKVMGMKEMALLGSVLSKPAKGMLAKSLWGVLYGIGFGAGLGLAFHLCQERTRELLRAGNASPAPVEPSEHS